MSAQWFYAKGGDTLGPYSASDLRIMLESGDIRAETLVWRDGLDWAPLGTRPELTGRVAPSGSAQSKPSSSPHPLSSPHPEPVEGRGRGRAREPRGTPALRQAQGEGAGGVAQGQGAGRVATLGQSADGVSPKRANSRVAKVHPARSSSSPHPEPVEGRGRDKVSAKAPNSIPPQTNNAVTTSLPSARPAAGPWSRFFARLVDIMLLIAILFAELLAIQKLRAIMPEGGFIPLQILALFSVLVLYFAITARFNSFGKAMIGIKAVPIAGQRLSLWQVIRREFSVYYYLITLGPPIGSFVNGVIAYLRVRAGQPVRYDDGRYKVVIIPGYSPWRIPGALVFALFCCAFSISLLFAVELAGTPWTNPQTGITVKLPKAWQHDTLALPALRFTNVGDLTLANFICTPRGAQTLNDYEAKMRAELETEGTWYATLGTNRDDLQMAVGQLGETATAALVVFGPAGENFCRLLSIDLTGTKMYVAYSPAFTDAVFESAGAAP